MKISPSHLIAAPLSALCFLPISAFAHTGIGHTTGFLAGFSHPVGGIDHLLAMLAVGLWAARMGGRAVWVVPGAFVSMMIIGGLLGIRGISVPYPEQGILLSVVALGVLIAGAFSLPLLVSGILAGIFALFHGHAHGTEMPTAISAVAYSAGFALATALLHAAGILACINLQKLDFGKISRFIGGAIVLGGIYLV